MVIDQVQLDDVTANQTLHVTTIPAGISQSATTVGNSAVGSADHAAVDYRASQTLNGDSHAVTNVAADNSAGDGLYVVTSAVGNTGTAGSCCAPLTGSATQTVAPVHSVTAETYVHTDGPASTGQVSADAAAIGNTQGWETTNGSINATTTQTHYGETYAALGATIGPVDGGSSYSVTAVANNVTADATNAPANLTVTQAVDGFRTRAGMDVAQESGSDVTAAATATDNNITVTSDGGHAASLASDQFNTNLTQAEVKLNVGAWSGTTTASSYGVANSALVSNAGASTAVDGNQNNTGQVSATTTFNGGSGGDATILATSVGNAYSAYACADCNGQLTATLRQSNSGGVSATTSTTTSSQGVIAGSASAVGNTATFQVHKN